MDDRSPLITILQFLGGLFPGNWLKTFAYRILIYRPRRLLRNVLYAFYRQEHVYDVLSEFSRRYTGDFSILEFGVADGYSFTRKLYATRYLRVEDRVTVHGFDSFEGTPASDDDRDQDVIADDGWVEGQFAASYDALDAYCKARCRNYRLHRGTFETTLNDQVLAEFERRPPILVWIDCDYYTSARVVFERLIPYIPSGCVIYFDEYEFNYGSRFTGEARVVHEINQGQFGEGVELVLDTDLSFDSKRVYRFINLNARTQFVPRVKTNLPTALRRRTNDSPFP